MDIVGKIGELKDDWCSEELLQNLYDLSISDEDLMARFKGWADLYDKDSIKDRKINRYMLETFLQSEGFLPRKVAAIRLGMATDSLNEVITKLETKKLIDPTISKSIVEEKVIRKITKYLPSIRYNLFSDHDNFCDKLHDAILTDLDIEVDVIKCSTANALGEDDYAHDYDSLNNEPVGLRYQIWLQTNKPINLRPDICSLKTLASYEILKELLFPGQENYIDNEKLQILQKSSE